MTAAWKTEYERREKTCQNDGCVIEKTEVLRSTRSDEWGRILEADEECFEEEDFPLDSEEDEDTEYSETGINKILKNMKDYEGVGKIAGIILLILSAFFITSWFVFCDNAED